MLCPVPKRCSAWDRVCTAVAKVMRRAVGGGDQHSSNLRIGADFVFQPLQIEAAGIEAAFDRHLHVSHQRRTVCQLTTTLQIHRQRHARRQRRHLTGHLFTRVQQQVLQTLGQVFHVQGFGQVRRGRQRQSFAHAGAVVAAAHQNERQRRIALALAHIAQNIQAIDAGQLPVNDHQVVRIFRQQVQRLLAIGAQVQPRVAAHIQQHLLEQVAGPGVGLGNQHSRCSG